MAATAPGILPVRVDGRLVVVASAAGPLTPVVGLLPTAPGRLRATGLTAVAAVHATTRTTAAATLWTATAARWGTTTAAGRGTTTATRRGTTAAAVDAGTAAVRSWCTVATVSRGRPSATAVH
ncbi:hypothetical protein DDE19_27700, partial [Micromonospora ureilytica]